MKAQFKKILLITLSLLSYSSYGDTPWTERVNIFGDFRFRQEYSNTEQTSPASDLERNRSRIRARLGVSALVNADVEAFVRLTTAENGNAVSGNQTLGDGASKKDISLDWAYVHWKAFESGNVKVGKFDTPFFRPMGSQLIWDSDLSPEGGAFNYSYQDENMNFFTNLATFSLVERNTAGETEDSGVLGAQVGASKDLGPGVFKASLAYYTFTNLKGKSALFANGNSLDISDQYLHDYNLISGNLYYELNVGAKKLAFLFDYVTNTGVDEYNEGMLAGLSYGSLAEPGDWMLSYNWRSVDADAVVAGLQDSDFSLGQTDTEGHFASIGYGVAQNTQAFLSFYLSELSKEKASRDFEQVQLDVSFKF